MLKFSAKLQQYHELCNRKIKPITHWGGGNLLIINKLQLQSIKCCNSPSTSPLTFLANNPPIV